MSNLHSLAALLADAAIRRRIAPEDIAAFVDQEASVLTAARRAELYSLTCDAIFAQASGAGVRAIDYRAALLGMNARKIDQGLHAQDQRVIDAYNASETLAEFGEWCAIRLFGSTPEHVEQHMEVACSDCKRPMTFAAWETPTDPCCPPCITARFDATS